VDVQLAEAATECLLLIDVDLLVAEKDYQVPQQRLVDFPKGLVAERSGE
jgi:hypothetical protein